MSVNGPTVVRRQLGRRLRQARAEAGKTIDGVVASGVVSKATLHRYEGGRAAITPGTVLELSLLYGVDSKTTKALYDLAIGSQVPGWWEDQGTSVATGFAFYLGLESAASVIHSYAPELLEGLLQTADYARAVEQADAARPDEQTVENIVAIRLKRQQAIFERIPPAAFTAILAPGVLTRQVGGPKVMAEQIAHLRRLVEQNRVALRILPWEHGAHAALAGPFTVLRYDDPDDPAVVYVETAVGGSYFELPAQLARYGLVFDAVYQQSIPFEEYPL